MKKVQIASEESSKAKRPALSEEAREKQMIALATDLAEKQLREGTASAQVITHFLKLGSTREKVEKDILNEQKKLYEAKTEAINTANKPDEMYEAAINALKGYKGSTDEDD